MCVLLCIFSSTGNDCSTPCLVALCQQRRHSNGGSVVCKHNAVPLPASLWFPPSLTRQLALPFWLLSQPSLVMAVVPTLFYAGCCPNPVLCWLLSQPSLVMAVAPALSCSGCCPNPVLCWLLSQPCLVLAFVPTLSCAGC